MKFDLSDIHPTSIRGRVQRAINALLQVHLVSSDEEDAEVWDSISAQDMLDSLEALEDGIVATIPIRS